MLVSDKAMDGTLISKLGPSSEKKVFTKCDDCGVQSQTTYANYRNSQEARGNPGTTYCRGCAARISASLRKGKPAHNKGKKLPASQRGENHPSWKGGRYIDKHGYVMVYIGGEKQEIGWSSYKKEHILVVEEVLDRKLTPEELVHHVDGDKQNNKEENLWVCNSDSHRFAHQSLQELGYELIRKGQIVFNRQTGRYQWRN